MQISLGPGDWKVWERVFVGGARTASHAASKMATFSCSKLVNYDPEVPRITRLCLPQVCRVLVHSLLCPCGH